MVLLFILFSVKKIFSFLFYLGFFFFDLIFSIFHSLRIPFFKVFQCIYLFAFSMLVLYIYIHFLQMLSISFFILLLLSTFIKGPIALSVMKYFIARFRYSFAIVNDHDWSTLIYYYLTEFDKTRF